MTEFATSTPPTSHEVPLAVQQVEADVMAAANAAVAADGGDNTISNGESNFFPVCDHFDQRTHRHIADPEHPTMRGMLWKERGGGYTKYTILSDIIDEAMLKCMKNHGRPSYRFLCTSC